MAEMEPLTRQEMILDGMDIEPITRLEYFLKKATQGGGGGSSLPPYTSADKGKVLTVGEGSESETVVIVPEQTVTIGESPVVLSGADSSGFILGTTAHYEAVSHGEFGDIEYEGDATCQEDDGVLFFTIPQCPGIALLNGEVVAAGGHAGDWTISLTASVSSVEPKWEVGLPPYTSSDNGKALTVVVPESTVIPAQTTAFTNGYGTYTGVDFSALKIGDVITFTGTALGQSLSITGEVVADGDDVQIVFRNDYFKSDGSAYLEELAAFPFQPVSVTADAVTVTGDATASWNFPALVVKAEGTATKSGSTSFTITVGVDVPAEKIAECFTPNKARPVFVLVPTFGPNEPYYDYDTYNQMFLLNNCSEAYLIGDNLAVNYLKYDGTNNTLVYGEQGQA